jgi:hypothetical protein
MIGLGASDRYHLVSNLGEAMERDLQQLQIDARRQLTQTVAGRPREAKKLTPPGSEL